MTETEAEKIFSIFTDLLDSIQTSVFQVNGMSGAEERLIFRKTFPTHYALCSWPLDSITGFFPYSLALDNQALGCRHSIGTTSTDYVVCIAAPNIEALQQAVRCIRETNEFFVTPAAAEAPELPIWVKGPNERLVEIKNYRGEDLGRFDLDKDLAT